MALWNAGCQPATVPAHSVPAGASNHSSPPATSIQQPLIGDSSRARFVDQALLAGVEFDYRNGEEAGRLAILESLGGGVGFLDYDQDGALDLFVPGGGGFDQRGQVIGRPGALFRQLEPWSFQPVTGPAGVDSDQHYTHGAAIADADNDGFPDVLVTGYGGLMFFRNQGDGTFAESAAECGLDDRMWSSSAAWGDLNQDGVPDLYVAHYVDWSPENNPSCMSIRGDRPDVCSPRKFQPLPDALYLGLGDGTFRDGSRDAGLSPRGKGLGVLLEDMDLDGLLDVYVANDTEPNFFYRNSGAGRLENLSDASGTAVNDRGLPDGSMGVDLGDYNLDGLPDLWVSNYERESFALYRNFGDCIFRHVSLSTGITAVGDRFVGWGTVFFDVDSDGDEDVFVSNGHVVHFPDPGPVAQSPLLFENLKGQRFQDISALAGEWMASRHPGRGCGAGDLDRDGDLDLAVSLVNSPAALLDNQTPQDNHWLQIRLVGTISSRDATGARVTVRTSLGAQSRQVKGGSSYASTGDRCLHFGLAQADRIESVEIAWPSGVTQTLTGLTVDRRHMIHEPTTDRIRIP